MREDDTVKGARVVFLVGAGGLLAAGGMIVGGIVLNHRYHEWKSRPLHERSARHRVLPTMGWNGRTHMLGLQGRF